MKNILAITLFVAVIGLIVSMAAMPSRAINTAASSDPSVETSVPDSVGSIFEKSCYPCHSAPGKSMAMSKLNFDKWDSYKPEKQADKAEDICEEVTKGGMPPKSFKTNNPDKAPTEAEIKILCNWAATFPKD